MDYPISAKTVERLIQGYSKQALGFTISCHSLRTTYGRTATQSAQPFLHSSSGGAKITPT